MTSHMQKIQVDSVYGSNILVETDGQSRIIINEAPHGFIHESDNKMLRHQFTNMMVFQEKLSMLFRASLKAAAISLPLPPSKYGVKVHLISSRRIRDLPMAVIKATKMTSPLLNVLKSVIDSLNGQVISNDNQLYSAEIVYDQTPKAGLDYLEVELFEVVKRSSKSVARIATEVYIVPKEPPIVYDAPDKYMLFSDLQCTQIAEPLKSMVNLPKLPSYHIDLQFVGDVETRDIDNMSKTYWPILNELGLEDDDMHRITITKWVNKKKVGQIGIEVLPNTLHHGNIPKSPTGQAVRGKKQPGVKTI
ncbi:hypothetical protein [Paenibacillus sp. PL2-23]|uniref:hypothetical protein n=1 Tax=Paenibacillus sp. PL2-23 TaxID=2100729 RepID=UPI0030F8C8FE